MEKVTNVGGVALPTNYTGNTGLGDNIVAQTPLQRLGPEKPVSSTVVSNANFIENTKPQIDSRLAALTARGQTVGADGFARDAGGNLVAAPIGSQAGENGGYVDSTGIQYGKEANQYSDDPAQNALYSRQFADLDANTKELVDSYHAQYEGYRAKQNQINAAQEAGKEQELLMGGGSRYAQGSSGDIVALQRKNSLDNIIELDNQERVLVAQAKSAQQNKQYDLLNKLVDQAETVKKEKQAAAVKANDDIAQALKDQKKAQADIDAQNKKDLRSAYSDAINAGADPADLNKAKTPEELMAIAAPYLKQKQALDETYKKAQIAKIYSDINESSAGGSGGSYNGIPLPKGLDTSNAIAYAQQFAATGEIPVGIPKGSFGAISAIGKDLPKAEGTLVSVVTGVAPKSSIISQEKKDALVSLYNAVEKSGELKDEFGHIIPGIVGGTLGKLFGSDAQAAYLSSRDLTLKELQYALSGKAITQQEFDYFNSLLPGRFSNAAGLGVSGQKKIDNFMANVSKTLDNKMDAYGLAVVGYSKVKAADGNEYTVGQVLEGSNGAKARVNADGSLTPIQ